jgi:F-box protein 11
MTDQHNPAVFLSYTRFDDEYDQGALSHLREQLGRALRFAAGSTIDIFQDTEHIKLGQSIHTRIAQSLGAAMVFIPILTPSYITSTWCRTELERFLQREQHLGRADLIIPIYYQTVRGLEEARASAHATQAAADPLVRVLAPRLAADWRDLRALALDSREVRIAVERIAGRIIEVLEELQAAPPPPAIPAEQLVAPPGTSGNASERTSEQRSGVFVGDQARIYGPVVGSSSGQITTSYQISPDDRPAPEQRSDPADSTPE